MKIIDCHTHLHFRKWLAKDYPENDFIVKTYCHNNFGEKDILRNMNEAKISKTIVFPMPSKYIDLEAANNYILEQSKLHPEIIPFSIIDNKPEYWVEKGAKGFKEHVYGQWTFRDKKTRLPTFGQDFKETYKFMEEMGLPLILHSGTNRVERFQQDIYRDTPNLKIILAHLGADYPLDKNRILKTLKELKNFPKLWFDISTINEVDILRESFNLVGSEKLLFGSDFPEESPKKTLARLSLLNLSEKDLENVLFKNVERIL